MNCGMECVKYLLFIFNFVFALGGLAILVVGVIIRTHMGVFLDEAQIHINLPATLLIAVGAIIFIIAFFGCCGAIRESHCMIVTFAVMLLTLLVIQIAAATYTFISLKNKDIETTINSEVKRLVDHYYDSKLPTKDGVNAIQILAKCCGFDGKSDFINNPNNQDKERLPYSCCSDKAEDDVCRMGEVTNPGCRDKVYPQIVFYTKALGGLAIAIAVIELIGIIFSFCLANSIRNVERRGYKV